MAHVRELRCQKDAAVGNSAAACADGLGKGAQMTNILLENKSGGSLHLPNGESRTSDRALEAIVQFVSPSGEFLGPQFAVPFSITRAGLEVLLNRLLQEQQQQEDASDVWAEEKQQLFAFTLEENVDDSGSLVGRSRGVDVETSLSDAFEKSATCISSERVLALRYAPLAPFRVRPVTRCSSSLEGHTDAVLCVAFSPDSTRLASGSGDKTVRLWDLNTETPEHTLRGHAGWVLCVAWAPHAQILASAGMDESIRLWDGETGETLGGGPLKGHTKPVTALAWQPLHLCPSAAVAAADDAAVVDDTEVSTADGDRGKKGRPYNDACLKNGKRRRTRYLPDLLLASASKDTTIRLWLPRTGQCLSVFSGHRESITQVKWSGEAPGFLFSASRDTTLKVWDVKDCRLLKDLKGHAHWINSLALSTDAVLRSGPFSTESKLNSFSTFAEMQAAARKRYQECVRNSGGERLLSGSDDNTLILWKTAGDKRGLMQVARMTGHQKLVNHVVFSPDGRLIASASFDKSIRLWDGQRGGYIATLRGHVGPVYQLAWSADSRLLLSGSGDSTLKVWHVETKKLKSDLPGHADEVYAVDWSVSGSHAASGSKDRILKIWRH